MAEGDASLTITAARLRPRPWLGRLRCALRAGLFVLHYQPIVALDSGEISHCEALVRLADEPGGRLTAPGAFLPAAERHGLAPAIDRLVVDRVAALLGEAPAGSVSRVAINLSALSVTDDGMLAHIERRLAHHWVDPARLVVELTETAAIGDMRRARAFCEGARALGCAVALDDFGVGFGSLRYAKHLPFDYLKIDGDFVHGLAHSDEDRVVVRAIVDVARGMGGQTIAECVADEPTLDALGELGVDYAQGFWIGRPTSAAETGCASPRPRRGLEAGGAGAPTAGRTA
jgi:EAL domain-containing protein (putative c-di-GMP-specific phosphodiesterase class I)